MGNILSNNTINSDSNRMSALDPPSMSRNHSQSNSSLNYDYGRIEDGNDEKRHDVKEEDSTFYVRDHDVGQTREEIEQDIKEAEEKEKTGDELKAINKIIHKNIIKRALNKYNTNNKYHALSRLYRDLPANYWMDFTLFSNSLANTVQSDSENYKKLMEEQARHNAPHANLLSDVEHQYLMDMLRMDELQNSEHSHKFTEKSSAAMIYILILCAILSFVQAMWRNNKDFIQLSYSFMVSAYATLFSTYGNDISPFHITIIACSHILLLGSWYVYRAEHDRYFTDFGTMCYFITSAVLILQFSKFLYDYRSCIYRPVTFCYSIILVAIIQVSVAFSKTPIESELHLLMNLKFHFLVVQLYVQSPNILWVVKNFWLSMFLVTSLSEVILNITICQARLTCLENGGSAYYILAARVLQPITFFLFTYNLTCKTGILNYLESMTFYYKFRATLERRLSEFKRAINPCVSRSIIQL